MAETRRNANTNNYKNNHTTPIRNLQPGRLQKKRPASLEIAPVRSSNWNAVIPLLSPLYASPPRSDINRTAEIRSSNPVGPASAESPQRVVCKKWQHPAAPFCYEPAAAGSFTNSSFVPV